MTNEYVPSIVGIEPVKKLPNCKDNCKRTRGVLSKIQQKIMFFIGWNKQKNFLDTTKEELKEELKLSDRQAYYNIKELQRKGFVENKASNVYLLALTGKGQAYNASALNLQNDRLYVSSFRFLDRAHKITVVAKLASRPQGVVPAGFTASKASAKLRWKHPALAMVDATNGITVLITDASVSFGFKSVYGIDPHHIVHAALIRSVDIANGLKAAGFKVLLPSYAIVQQHHAISNKDFAEFTAKFDFHWLSDTLVFDKSVQPNEYELVNHNTAPEDFVRLTDMLELFARGEVTKEQLKELVKLLPDLKRLLEKRHDNEGS